MGGEDVQGPVVIPVRAQGARWRGVAVLVAAAVVLVSALLWRQGVPSSTPTPAPVRHVRGLGVNPGDDTLYAATHHRLYRLADNGPARLVSTRTTDLMGFTVVGPDRFLAGGHPDGRGDEPWSLGLVEPGGGVDAVSGP